MHDNLLKGEFFPKNKELTWMVKLVIMEEEMLKPPGLNAEVQHCLGNKGKQGWYKSLLS